MTQLALSRRGLLTLLAVPEFPDIRSVSQDLFTPPRVTGEPAPGRRVRQTLPQYKETAVHHALYLPSDWRHARRFPVIVEYACKGNYRNQYGDVSEGTVEGSNIGYGVSGGKGCIWLCLPFSGILTQARSRLARVIRVWQAG